MSCLILLYFASLSHFRYQETVFLHLQDMSQIHMTHPGCHKHFMNWLYLTLKRSFLGISPNRGIDKDFMCSLKTSWDLTRRRGTKVCSEIPFNKISCHLKTSRLICSAYQSTGFYVIRVLLKCISK